jgi:hypothetical protein
VPVLQALARFAGNVGAVASAQRLWESAEYSNQILADGFLAKRF